MEVQLNQVLLRRVTYRSNQFLGSGGFMTSSMIVSLIMGWPKKGYLAGGPIKEDC